MAITENLGRVRTRIDQACRAAGREPGEVSLLPVSKTFGTDAIRAAYGAGVRIVGENKVQEAAGKASELAESSATPGLRWALIGHLQTNKVKDVVGFADEFHALDSEKLAEALQRRLDGADRTLEVFVQVNSSGEDTKSGLAPDQVVDFVAGLKPLDRLRVRGLMTLAANSDDDDRVRNCFTLMRQLRDRMRDDDRIDGDVAELSMGMSGDFELAIAEGATTVRVGQAIFGSRPQAPAA